MTIDYLANFKANVTESFYLSFLNKIIILYDYNDKDYYNHAFELSNEINESYFHLIDGHPDLIKKDVTLLFFGYFCIFIYKNYELNFEEFGATVTTKELNTVINRYSNSQVKEILLHQLKLGRRFSNYLLMQVILKFFDRILNIKKNKMTSVGNTRLFTIFLEKETLNNVCLLYFVKNKRPVNLIKLIKSIYSDDLLFFKTYDYFRYTELNKYLLDLLFNQIKNSLKYKSKFFKYFVSYFDFENQDEFMNYFKNLIKVTFNEFNNDIPKISFLNSSLNTKEYIMDSALIPSRKFNNFFELLNLFTDDSNIKDLIIYLLSNNEYSDNDTTKQDIIKKIIMNYKIHHKEFNGKIINDSELLVFWNKVLLENKLNNTLKINHKEKIQKI